MSTVVKREATVHEFTKPIEVASRSRAELFFNRELGLLEFHGRVLEEAFDERNPLLERLKFLSIFSSNLDEFFMIRVSGLKEELEHEVETSPDGLTPAQQLAKCRERTLALIAEQSRCLREDVLPRLDETGISVVTYDSLSRHEKERLADYFVEKVFPVLTPLAVDPSHPFPYISPLSLNLGLMVQAPAGRSPADPKQKQVPRFVRIKVPPVVPRLVPVGRLGSKFVLLEDLIAANVETLFPGMIVGDCHRFRVTRDADIEVREEEAEDLLRVIQQELRQRRFGTPVRLEVSSGMPGEMISYLTDSLGLVAEDVYKVHGPLSLQDLSSFYDLNRPDLKFQPFTPALPEWLGERSLFDVITEEDILLHHPFDAYNTVTDFINEAVDDDDVVAIKICLYRTGTESPIPPALIRAADKCKQVTALIEIKARFDEEHNIEWGRKLDQAGVHVVYGVLGLKTHGKLTLVVRREGTSLKRYVHVASGNYNPTTSCFYTDVGMFTSDDAVGADATEMFNYLTGCSRQMDYRKLLVAPVNLKQKITDLIDREIRHCQEGRPARIVG